VTGDEDQPALAPSGGRRLEGKAGPGLEKRVDAAVARHHDPAPDARFAPQILRGVLAGREEQIRERVDGDPVALLGPGPVEIERAQPGLDMRDRDRAIAGRERSGGGAGRVAVDEHEIGGPPPETAAKQRSKRRPKALHGPVARLEAELAKALPRVEMAGKARMLAGQKDLVLDPGHALERPGHRRHLDRLRASADDRDDEGHVPNLAGTRAYPKSPSAVLKSRLCPSGESRNP
jgi:hypothetical protein